MFQLIIFLNLKISNFEINKYFSYEINKKYHYFLTQNDKSFIWTFEFIYWLIYRVFKSCYEDSYLYFLLNEYNKLDDKIMFWVYIILTFRHFSESVAIERSTSWILTWRSNKLHTNIWRNQHSRLYSTFRVYTSSMGW